MTTPSAANTALAEELLPRWIDNPTCPIDRPYSRRLVSADECRPAVALALQSKDDSAALEIARLRAALAECQEIAVRFGTNDPDDVARKIEGAITNVVRALQGARS